MFRAFILMFMFMWEERTKPLPIYIHIICNFSHPLQQYISFTTGGQLVEGAFQNADTYVHSKMDSCSALHNRVVFAFS